MNISLSFTVKRYKTALSKAYIDIVCTADTSDSCGASIFVMQQLPKNALNESTYRFSHVADPVDLQDYPQEQLEDSAYFRTNEITLRVRSQYQVQLIVQTMRKEVQALAHALSAPPESEEVFSQTFIG